MPEFVGAAPYTMPAATGLRPKRFVQMSTNGGVLRYPKNGDPIDGVLFADGTTGQTVSGIGVGVQSYGIAEVEANGSSLHVGHHVAASSVGRAILWTTGKICVGKVMIGSSGSTNRILSVRLNSGFGHSTAVT